ncbi:hypothetical protein V2W45_1470381 [Cenococcum geophilum]
MLIDYTSLIARVLSGFSPLEDLKENRLLKAVAIIRENPDTIISNNYHKKAKIILVKLLSISLKVFFLYAISTTLDALKHRDNLPYRAMPQGGVFLVMPLYNLLDFLKDKYINALVQINCLFNKCFLPFIKIEFGLGIIKAIVKYSI